MKTLVKIAKYLLSSIILFTIASTLISLSVWLDMRIHARHVVYASFLIMLIFFIVKKDLKSIKTLLIGEALMLLSFAIGKFPRISYELRDAFYLPIKINKFMPILIGIIVITSLIVIVDYLKNKNTVASSKN